MPPFDILSDKSDCRQAALSNSQSGRSFHPHPPVPTGATDETKGVSHHHVDEFGDINESEASPDTEDMFNQITSEESSDVETDVLAARQTKTKAKKQAVKSTRQPPKRRRKPTASPDAGNNGLPINGELSDGPAMNDDIVASDVSSAYPTANQGRRLKREELNEIKAFVDDADVIATRMADRFGISVSRLWSEAGFLSKNQRAVSAWDGFQRLYSDTHKHETDSTSKRLSYKMCGR